MSNENKNEKKEVVGPFEFLVLIGGGCLAWVKIKPQLLSYYYQNTAEIWVMGALAVSALIGLLVFKFSKKTSPMKSRRDALSDYTMKNRRGF